MQHNEFTLHLKAVQEKRIADYVALHKRLDTKEVLSLSQEGVADVAFELSRKLDQLSIDIKKHDVHGRKVGQILGWDKRKIVVTDHGGTKLANDDDVVCIRCNVVLDTDEGLQTGICSNCWKPETDIELFS